MTLSCLDKLRQPSTFLYSFFLLLYFSRVYDSCTLNNDGTQVAFSEVTANDLPPMGADELSVKLIHLSQLTIEYLLHVQVRNV